MEKAAAPIWALGLMSGTSMDGIDAAALLTDGVEIQAFGPKRFEAYTPEQKALLRAGQGLWQGDPDSAAISAAVTDAHAAIASAFPASELIGFHGVTLAHDPLSARTHQAGDGAALAEAVQRRVVWDFRTADMASGGEGAPLVPVFHFACARLAGETAPVAILNIGGVANVTWVDPTAPSVETPGAVVAFDTGPGNALIDDLMHARLGRDVDTDGETAGAGRVDEAVVARVLDDPFFSRPAPKSLDRNHFSALADELAAMASEDAAATLTAITAATVAAAVRHMPAPPGRWLVCGGGRHNATLMRMIGARTNAPVLPVEEIGLDGDFLEAQAFAYLAVRVQRGLPTSLPATTGARLPVCGGRISTHSRADATRYAERARQL